MIFSEVKLVKGLCLEATTGQEQTLFQLWRPPHAYSLMLGYHPRKGRLYAGHHGQEIETLPWIPRPSRLDSADWGITALLESVLP